METIAYRWVCPDNGPVAKPADLAKRIAQELAHAPTVYCSARDMAELQSTLIGRRVAWCSPAPSGSR